MEQTVLSISGVYYKVLRQYLKKEFYCYFIFALMTDTTSTARISLFKNTVALSSAASYGYYNFNTSHEISCHDVNIVADHIHCICG